MITRHSIPSSTTCLPSSSPCQRPTDWPVSETMWCSSFTSTRDGTDTHTNTTKIPQSNKTYQTVSKPKTLCLFPQALPSGQNQSEWIWSFLRWKTQRKDSQGLERRGVIGFQDVISAGFVFSPLVPTDFIWYQLSWFYNPEAPGKPFFTFWPVSGPGASTYSWFCTFSIPSKCAKLWKLNIYLSIFSRLGGYFLFYSVRRDREFRMINLWPISSWRKSLEKTCCWLVWMAGSLLTGMSGPAAGQTLLSFGMKVYT